MSPVVAFGCFSLISFVLVITQFFWISDLLRSNRELHDKLNNAKLYNDANKATAQGILDQLVTKRNVEATRRHFAEARLVEAERDLKLCSSELRTTESLLARKTKRVINSGRGYVL